MSIRFQVFEGCPAPIVRWLPWLNVCSARRTRRRGAINRAPTDRQAMYKEGNRRGLIAYLYSNYLRLSHCFSSVHSVLCYQGHIDRLGFSCAICAVNRLVDWPLFT